MALSRLRPFRRLPLSLWSLRPSSSTSSLLPASNQNADALGCWSDEAPVGAFCRVAELLIHGDDTRSMSSMNVPAGTRKEDTEDVGDDNGDVVLTKRLNKQRRRAVAAAQGALRSLASKNFYKDKGDKSTHKSRVQRLSCKWRLKFA